MSAANEVLLPCPFCGGTVNPFKGHDSIQFFPCDQCGAIASFRGVGPNLSASIAAWNRRAPQEAWTLETLRAMNAKRQVEWGGGSASKFSLSFHGNELAGETGEACNVVKKLEREALGLPGSRATKEQLAEELADVVICADLVALTAGVDLYAAVPRKFNATSAKVGLTTKMPAPPASTTKEGGK